MVIELKSPSREGIGVENTYNQLRNYMQDIPSLFIYNAICIYRTESPVCTEY